MEPDFIDILIFEVNGQRHGLPVARVQELLPALSILPVPGDPPGIEGVINLRGMIVPVVDVRVRFGLPTRPLAVADYFIVARTADGLLVLHVDRAVELARADAGALARGPNEKSGARVVKVGDGIVVLHQIDDFLSALPITPGKEAERS